MTKPAKTNRPGPFDYEGARRAMHEAELRVLHRKVTRKSVADRPLTAQEDRLTRTPSVLEEELLDLEREEDIAAIRRANAEAKHVVAQTHANEVTPESVANLRARIYNTVSTRLPDVDDVLTGRKVWSNQQTRLFTALLNKVTPDLSANFVKTEGTVRRVSELSRADLEKIVARELESKTAARVIDATSDITDIIEEVKNNK